jgi:DNA-binding CsgD family transcriptional regulator
MGSISAQAMLRERAVLDVWWRGAGQSQRAVADDMGYSATVVSALINRARRRLIARLVQAATAQGGDADRARSHVETLGMAALCALVCATAPDDDAIRLLVGNNPLAFPGMTPRRLDDLQAALRAEWRITHPSPQPTP